ncbi:hypothetical protein [Niabella drilacis]|uniref:Transcription elongation factor, GreA/GreB, C-term n=1 Tax=Niabella drilacis (strain DSM 25811 / CCM 8410 / CCUG 62505 / LMG 26954 / E90) TaxID=1285928 RepID=A0A1G6VUA6_NIADE|nr:hypothetical protein [Niabella drilacis]SDD56415.1 hypothetical protein SAMN04487894_110132 [Niabella drilacis]
MKKEILDVILKTLEKDATGVEQEISTQDTNAGIDTEATTDLDAISQRDQATDIYNLLQQPKETAANTVAIVKKYRDLLRNDVGPGALVETTEHFFLVGVVLPPLEINGKKVAGITTDAPAYANLEGKKKGDEVHLGEADYLILSVQ